MSNFGGGIGAASPYGFHWTSLQGYDDVTHTRGRYNLGIGVAVERMRENMFATSNPNGVFARTTQTSSSLLVPRSVTSGLRLALALASTRSPDGLTTWPGAGTRLQCSPDTGSRVVDLRAADTELLHLVEVARYRLCHDCRRSVFELRRQSSLVRASLDYGPSDFNADQTLSVHLTYPFPTPSHSKWYVREWRGVGNFSASAGSPFTPTIGGDPLGEGSVEPYDVPNRVVAAGCANPTNHHNAANYLKLQCFAFPSPAKLLGNLRRNSIVGPGLQTFDVSLFKDNTLRRIRGDLNVQLRAEVFNIFNHADLAPPLEHRALFNAQGVSINGAGQIVTTTTPSRQIQLGIKLVW